MLRAMGLGKALSAARCLLNSAVASKWSPRGPYVQGVTPTSAVIAWMSGETGAGVVKYGKTPELGREEVDLGIGRRHAVVITTLDPGSTYHYRVDSAGALSAPGTFRTAPAGEDSRFSFAVVGDSGNGGKGQMALADLLERLEPDFILHTGDVVYPNGEQGHYNRRFFSPYGDLIREIPVFPVLGNHDVREGNGAAFLENFHPSLGSTKRYYSFDWSDAHFVALDSELYYGGEDGSAERQKTFLERDLTATVKRLKIRGVTYVVSGGGGRRLYPAGKGLLTACSRSVHHAVVVCVDGGRLSLEAVEPDGTVLDRVDSLVSEG